MVAIAGGTASVLGGGKFSNGAMSAAFVFMFNEMGRTYLKTLSAGQIRKIEAFKERVQSMDIKTFNKTFALNATGLDIDIYKMEIMNEFRPYIIGTAKNLTENAIKNLYSATSVKDYVAGAASTIMSIVLPSGNLGFDFVKGTTNLRGIYVAE